MSTRTRPPVVAGLLPTAMAAATVLYTVLSVLAAFILDDLGMSRAELGWVVAVYSGASAILSPVVGDFADRFGARAGMLVVFAFTGIGFLALAFAGGFVSLMAAALIVGVGQAMGNPATNKVIADTYEPGSRGLITGIKQSGVQAATFLGGLLFPRLAEASGWRAVPIAVGCLILAVLVVAWWGLPDDPSRGDVGLRRAGAKPGRMPVATWWVAAYAFLMGAGGSPMFAFLPLYATEVVGMTETAAGFVIAVAGLVGVAARIGWSLYADRRGEFGAPMVVIGLIAAGAGALTMAAATVGPVALWAAAILSWMSISAWNSIAMLAVINHAGPELSGRASGIVLFGFLWGLAVSPPVFGWSVDRLGDYRPGLAVVIGLFAAATLTMLIYVRRSSGGRFA